LNVVELTKDLVRIHSENPPGNQEAIADFVESTMKQIGLEVERDQYAENKPNIIGALVGKNRRPVLMMNGHLDTVPVGDVEKWRFDPFEPLVEAGKLFGRGAADMKGGLAAMICAAEELAEANCELNGTLLITCVVDEEVTGYGTRNIIEKGYAADFGIVGEPTELSVQTASKGAIHYSITTHGRSAHSSLPHLGLNAIDQMVKVCRSIQDLSAELGKINHPLVGKPTIVVTTIRGGENEAFVPASCEIGINRRLVPGEDVKGAEEQLHSLLQKLRAKDLSLVITSKTSVECEPAETSSSERIVQVCRRAVAHVRGRDPGITGFPATCDMRFMVNQGRIPTVILGPGSLEQAHARDEHIEIRQIIDAKRIYGEVAKELLS